MDEIFEDINEAFAYFISHADSEMIEEFGNNANISMAETLQGDDIEWITT